MARTAVVDLRDVVRRHDDRLYRPPYLLLRGVDRLEGISPQQRAGRTHPLRVPDVLYPRAADRRSLLRSGREPCRVRGLDRHLVARQHAHRDRDRVPGVRGLSPGARPRGVGQLSRRSQGRRRAVPPPGAIVRRRRLHQRCGTRCDPGGAPGHEHRSLLGMAGRLSPDGRPGVPLAGRLVVPEPVAPGCVLIDHPR